VSSSNPSQDISIRISNVWKIFGVSAAEAMQAVQEQGLTKAQVLSQFNAVVGVADVSLSVQRGEIFCVMGLSGSGKSTLVRHFNRLLEPTAGTIEIDGTDVLALKPAQLQQFRNQKIGMVFQNFALLPHRSVLDNVAMPLEIRTTVFITHDLDEAVRVGNRIAIMHDGKVVQIGTAEDIVMNPADDYVADFVAGISRLKIVRAHAVMQPLDAYLANHPPLADNAPRVNENEMLSDLIKVAIERESAILVESGNIDVGVISRKDILRTVIEGADVS